ncbi:MAG: hypothetical protein UX75_C0009G0022 [Candidatus Moranbacteria bacterium GW2011_GWE2_47_10]|nr:MAG: hypothetical protein UX75_C0009G0022 [Candidatus Moranbacteria bacterium GW2011_GWE2_47_10]
MAVFIQHLLRGICVVKRKTPADDAVGVFASMHISPFPEFFVLGVFQEKFFSFFIR